MKTMSGIYVLVVTALLACAGQRRDAPPASDNPVEPSGAATYRAPLVVRVEGPEQMQPGSESELVVRLIRPRPTDSPIALRLSLPPGVELVDGQADEAITDAVSGTLTRRYRIRVAGGIPDRDIEVTASITGTDHAAHARDAYRFGRPAPKLAEPRRQADPVRVGNKNLGRPIPVGP